MKRLLQTIVALLPVLAAGCLPNAAWLPDSSGFVYTSGKDKDQLSLYDVEKKASRVLVEKGAGPAWPAVSADGKRIAVAVRKDDGTDVALEVAVFDRDGKELHRSAKLDWAKHGEGGLDTVAAQAFWVPEQDKLLLSCDGQTGVYDLKTNSVVKQEATVCTFGCSPIRGMHPDLKAAGNGYLAIRKDGDGPVFIDWDGKETKIKPTPKEAFDTKGDAGDPLQGMLFFPLMHNSHWDGSTGVVTWGDVHVKIDAEKYTAVVEHFPPRLSADGKVIQEEIALYGGVVVRAVELTKRYTKDRNADDPPFGSYRVEVQTPGAKEPKTLMDGAGYFMIYPSPDGKKAVVKCSKSLEAIFTESRPGEDVLFLIDRGGLADKIDLAK